MTALDTWLQKATKCLSGDSTAKVRREIQEHYESARETAIDSGASVEVADRTALSSLGDARTANRQYRRVLLTAQEAKMLRSAQWESSAVCARPALVWLFRAIPLAALCAAVALASGDSRIAHLFFFAGVLLGVLIAAPTLPLYTPLRARIFRYMKWPAILAAAWFAFGPGSFASWWGAITISLSGLIWIEWMRFSIRRKLPVAEWPKALFL